MLKRFVALLLTALCVVQAHNAVPVLSSAQAAAPVMVAPGRMTPSALTAAQDFENRRNADGVVFAHDFCFAAEVDQFRWGNLYGADPDDLNPERLGTTVYIADDGTSCGSLESRHRVGGTPNPSDWWRPMAPLTAAGNGTGRDDPADGGTMTRYSHTPTDQGDEKDDFINRNYYGPTIYHAADPGAFVGTEYWFQMRVKISANRGPAGNGEGGKTLYFTTITDSNTSQELVTNSYYNVGGLGPAGANLFQMYRSGGASLSTDNGDSTIRQIGGAYNGGICDSSPINASGCWFWPLDETTEGAGNFVTLLYHVIPGTNSGNDSVAQVWKAEWGETTYTKIWDQSNIDLGYQGDLPFGHNAIILSGYQNELVFTEEVWHRYDQIIFSHEWIAPPQVYEGFAGRPQMFEKVHLFAANEDYFYMPLYAVGS